jgi:peptide/nickel transport system permease protein
MGSADQNTLNANAPAAKSQLKAVWRRLLRNRMAVIGGGVVLFFVLVAIVAPLIAPYNPNKPDFMNRMQGPSPEHWLGTDTLGRDMLSRIIYGSIYSLLAGIVSVTIAAFVGTLLGLLSGYYGGWVDMIIMRFMDMLLAFPGILLAIAIISVLGRGLFNAMVSVGLYSVPSFARVVRSRVLSLREQEFVESARAIGSSNSRIIFRHILPNIATPVIIMSTMRLGTTILAAAALSFLGLGAQPPTPEWGAILSGGRDVLRVAPHIATFPGLAILITVVGFNLLGDGVRDALDPKLKDK